MARLTREEMLQVLKEGGTVTMNGTIYRRPVDLPTEAEMAIINGSKEDAVRVESSLLEQMEQLKAQLELLKNSPVAAESKEEKKAVRKAASAETETA